METSRADGVGELHTASKFNKRNVVLLRFLVISFMFSKSRDADVDLRHLIVAVLNVLIPKSDE